MMHIFFFLFLIKNGRLMRLIVIILPEGDNSIAPTYWSRKGRA
jgi:hypothetical protein